MYIEWETLLMDKGKRSLHWLSKKKLLGIKDKLFKLHKNYYV